MSVLRATVKRIANKLGVDIVRFPNRLNHLYWLTWKEQHRLQDAVELEEMYRLFVFPDLPHRNRKETLHDLIGTSIGEALYIIRHLHLSLKVPGDVCEFGVAQGATSKLLAEEIFELQERKLWLFDSFTGLPAPTKEDRLINDIFNLGTMAAYKGHMADPEDQVLDKLKSIKFPEHRIRIKKGWVKDTVKSDQLPNQICFAYVDLDLYEPIKVALDFIDALMPIGGHIIVDDYGWFSAGAQQAVDEFVARADTRFHFSLPIKCAGYFCVLSKTR
jgi:O-methyltransferase